MNPNIALSFQRPRFDPGEGQRNALAMRNAQMQEAANLMTMQNSMEDRRIQTAGRNALMGADFSTPEGLKSAAAAVGESGNPELAMKLSAAYRDMTDADRKRLVDDIDLFNKVAYGLTNAETYVPTYAWLSQNAPGTIKGYPPTYDEKNVPFIQQSVMGMTEWRAAQDRDRNFDLKELTTPTIEDRRSIAAAGAARTNVEVHNAPKLPPGFMWSDPNDPSQGVIPIPGGPVARDEAAAADQAVGRQEGRARAGGTVIQDLQRGLDIVQSNKTATGAPALISRKIPESDGQALEGFVQSALSNVGLDTLQAMRENSPTGGALGQVPIQQQKRLEQVLGSLDITQRRDIVEDNIKRVINIYMDIVYGTPRQIAELEVRGDLSPEEAAELSERHELSFDERGRKRPNTQYFDDKKNKPPAGVDAETWKFMTPEEKALFK